MLRSSSYVACCSWLFLVALFEWSCGKPASADSTPSPVLGSRGFRGMEVLDQPLASLATPCSFTAATGVASLAVADDENAIIYRRSVDNAVLVNGDACGTATTTNLKRITVTGSSGANSVTLDLISGLVGTGSTTSVGVDVDLAGGSDNFLIRGSSSSDAITFGSDGISINQDNFKDVSLANVESVTVSTGGGNDVVSGAGGYGSGNARSSSLLIYGGDGNDSLTGGSGGDTLNGDDGNDSIQGGAGTDTLNGGAGNDTFSEGTSASGADVFNGESGTDVVTYASRTSNITATIGGGGVSGEASEGDTIAADVEVITGGEGNDTLSGDANDNTLNGGPGNDVLAGGNGTDTLNGDAGNDTFNEASASNGSDTFNGGAGTDTVNYGSRGAAVTVTMDGTSANDGASGESDSVKSDVENCIGSAYGDSLTGNNLDNVLTGGAGNDTLSGGAGNDTFAEGATTNGSDSFVGGTGVDLVDYSSRTGDLTVTMGDSTANDGVSGENDNVGSDVENLEVGTGGTNNITGNDLDNSIDGNSGDDAISGGAGNDVLYGAGGTDTLNGDAGDDWLDGGLGTDTLNGGTGSGDICYGESVSNCEL